MTDIHKDCRFVSDLQASHIRRLEHLLRRWMREYEDTTSEDAADLILLSKEALGEEYQ